MYREYNDQELLYLVAENNEVADNILYEKYKPIIDIKVKKFITRAKKIGLEYNDLFQEGMLGLSEAIKAYKDNKDATFSTFASMCIERQLYSLLSSSNRKKHAFLNESCSLDNEVSDTGKTLMDMLFNENLDPSMMVEVEEQKEQLYGKLQSEFSSFEKEVFKLKMQGLGYKEIANKLNKSYKSIDTAIQRIKVKIRKFLDNDSI